MQRYFVNEKENNSFTLSMEDSYHIAKVMRKNLGDTIEIVNLNEIYLCSITSLDGNVKCQIVSLLDKNEINIPKIIIAQSLVKEQKMDYILQKSTELGVFKIIPVMTERSIIKLENKKDKKLDRWRKVLKEASEQSKRISIPEIDRIESLKDLLEEKATFKFICSVKERAKTIKSVLSNVSISDTILFVIGPEGGLSEEEEEFLLNNGFLSISLGDNVLRTESASLFVLSAVNYEFMR